MKITASMPSRNTDVNVSMKKFQGSLPFSAFSIMFPICFSHFSFHCFLDFIPGARWVMTKNVMQIDAKASMHASNSDCASGFIISDVA